MGDRSTRRAVIGVIGGTAVVGIASVLGGAQADDGEDQSSSDDYWRVTEETAETTVTEDTDEDVRSEGDVYVGRGVTLNGLVQADGHVLVGPGAVVTGPVEAVGAVVVDKVVDVDGGITATDDVILGVEIDPAREAYRAGDLRWASNLPMEGGVVVGDDVTSAGHVLVGPESVLEGDVAARRASDTSEADERVEPPSVLLGSWVDVLGDVAAAGHVVLGPNTAVDGTVTAGGTALFGDGATFGEMNAGRIDEGEAADVWGTDGDGAGTEGDDADVGGEAAGAE